MPSLDNNVNIVVNSEANTSGIDKARRSLNELDGQSDKSSGHFGNLSNQFALGQLKFDLLSNAANFLGGQLRGAFEEASQASIGQAQLTAAIASTGGAAGVTAQAATDLATSIQKTTPIEDDAVLAAENMLLTFTNIHANVFPATTRAVTDMATAMNNGLTPNAAQLKDTAIQVGIAMNDPINGISRLHRVGVAFTEVQKQQIKHFQDTGDVAGAQNIILKELNTEFGGRGVAAAQTYAGKMEMLRNSMKDLKEGVGTALQTALVPLLVHLSNFASKIDWAKLFTEIGNGFTKIKNAVTPVIMTIIDLAEKTAKFLKPSWDALIGQISTMMPQLKLLWNDILKPLAIFLGIAFVAALWLVINVLRVVMRAVADVINWFHNMIIGIAEFINWVSGLWNRVAGGIINFKNNMLGFASSTVDGFVNFFKALPGRVISAIGNIGATVGNQIKGALHSFHIPGFATGVRNYSGGLAVVGEKGPELVNLPRGADVFTAGESKSMMKKGMGGQTTHNHYGNVYLADRSAVQEYFIQIDRDNMLMGKGLSPARGMS